MELLELEGILSTKDEIVVPLVAVCGDCKLGTWEAGERMEEESIENCTDGPEDEQNGDNS